MKLLKEVYLSIFVLFYRIGAGQWPAYMDADAHKGVAGVTIIEAFLVIILGGWIEIFVGRELGLKRWVVGISILLLYGANLYMLVIKGGGVTFEKQFNHFEKSKRITLLLAALAVVLATGVFYAVSAQYHRAWVFQRKADLSNTWMHQDGIKFLHPSKNDPRFFGRL